MSLFGHIPPQHPLFSPAWCSSVRFYTSGSSPVLHFRQRSGCTAILPTSSVCTEHTSETLCDSFTQDHAVDIPSGNGPSRVHPTQLIQPPSQHHQDQQKSQGLLLYCRQFWALFVKRAISAKRDRLAVVMQLLVPILLVLLALRAGKASSSLVQEPSLLISRCAVVNKPLLFCIDCAEVMLSPQRLLVACTGFTNRLLSLQEVC